MNLLYSQSLVKSKQIGVNKMPKRFHIRYNIYYMNNISVIPNFFFPLIWTPIWLQTIIKFWRIWIKYLDKLAIRKLSLKLRLLIMANGLYLKIFIFMLNQRGTHELTGIFFLKTKSRNVLPLQVLIVNGLLKRATENIAG